MLPKFLPPMDIAQCFECRQRRWSRPPIQALVSCDQRSRFGTLSTNRFWSSSAPVKTGSTQFANEQRFTDTKVFCGLSERAVFPELKQKWKLNYVNSSFIHLHHQRVRWRVSWTLFGYHDPLWSGMLARTVQRSHPPSWTGRFWAGFLNRKTTIQETPHKKGTCCTRSVSVFFSGMLLLHSWLLDPCYNIAKQTLLVWFGRKFHQNRCVHPRSRKGWKDSIVVLALSNESAPAQS